MTLRAATASCIAWLLAAPAAPLAAAQAAACASNPAAMQQLTELLQQRHEAPPPQAITMRCTDAGAALRSIARSVEAPTLARLRAVQLLQDYNSAPTRTALAFLAEHEPIASLRWLAGKQLQALREANTAAP